MSGLFPAADIINDPNFRAEGGFTIRRYTVSVDSHGMAVKSSADIHAEGTIVPSGSVAVERTADAERQADQISVYTTTPIQTGDESVSRIADDIVYGGHIYQVTDQDDYSEWGFNIATAVLQDPGGRPGA